MNNQRIKNAMSRRRVMGWAAGGMAVGMLPLTGWADDEASTSSVGSTRIALASTGLTGKRVVVVGGGMAGMTAAKYLRLWGGSGVQVTLVEPDTLYTSSIMSNLVLKGSRTLASLQFKRDALSTNYGVIRKAGSVVGINAGAHTVALSDKTVLPYDRLVLAPGGEFRRRLRTDPGRLRRPYAARVARRCADPVAAQPGGRHAQWRHLRDDHFQGTLPLSLRTV
jgi:hypothetical protein